MKLKINLKKLTQSWVFQRTFTFVVCMLAVFTIQAAGKADLEVIATQIGEYQTTVKNILYAVAAIISLVGAFNIFNKMSNGDQDVKKTIMLTLGGCIGFVALAKALPAFFGQ